ncbi:MAG: DNA-processing protein DprA [Candidatus Omnitrophica bacterium]|nr:DNA-processing protein DprA [Candidatus Omnitrophota bacterium]
MNENSYLMALSHLPRWRTEKINKLLVQILKELNLTFAEFFDSDDKDLANTFKLNTKEISDIQDVKNELPNYAYLADELLNQRYEIIPIYSTEYPKSLKDNLRINFSPPVIYVKGNKELLHEEKVAVVGSRDVSDKGFEFTKKITQKLVKQGNVIVSGFAKGVDRLSLDVSIDNNGKSIIVLPQGILTFASGFKKYYQNIIKGEVLVLSAFHPKAPWSVGLAMSRNRYIYGLANDIYVAESNSRGGTWEGVMDGLRKIKKFKMEEYRKIYVRHAAKDEKCANNLLIKHGAIGINDELEVVKKPGPKEKQQTFFDE